MISFSPFPRLSSPPSTSCINPRIQLPAPPTPPNALTLHDDHNTSTVPPENVWVVSNGRAVTSVVGPYREKEYATLTCKASGGKSREMNRGREGKEKNQVEGRKEDGRKDESWDRV